MVLELSKAFSFFLSLLSLYPVMMSAFFEPGSHWQERLGMAALKMLLAAVICFASGILFCWPVKSNPDSHQALVSTLPVKVFFSGIAGMAILFAVSWYLEEYYIPLLHHSCCRP